MIKNKGVSLEEMLTIFTTAAKKQSDAEKARTQAESERRAKLTPEQRAAEIDAAEKLAEADRVWRLDKHLAPAVTWLRDHDSVTIRVFANCLAGLKPKHETLTLFTDHAEETGERFNDILKSCVGTQLIPLNQEAPDDKKRFTVKQLFEVASRKGLGFHNELRVRWQPPVALSTSGWESDVDRLLAKLDAALLEHKMDRAEFFKRGSRKALYRYYCEKFKRTTADPISDKMFAEYINSRHYRFQPGTRGAIAEKVVFDLLSDKISPSPR